MSDTRQPALHPAGPVPPEPVADPVRGVCPYLVAADGAWRSIEPTREHRCSAMHPPAEPAPAKQRELCLRPTHAGCATFVTARELEVSGAPRVPGDAVLWPPAQSTVLAIERARTRVSLLQGPHARLPGQGLLVILVVAAFGVLAVTRTVGPSGPAPSTIVPGGAASSVAPATATAPVAAQTQAPLASPTLAPTISPQPGSPSPAASPSATLQGTPTAPSQTYTVRRGDTLSSIAAAHGTTVRKLMKANGLTSTVIRVGDVLVIP